MTTELTLPSEPSDASAPFEVPVIDISGWSTGDPGSRIAVIRAVDDALRRVGFMQIVGHGVDPTVIQRMLDACDEFFALPPEAKAETLPPSADVNRGWAPFGTESLRYSLGDDAPPDLFEAFNIGRDVLDESDPAIAAERHRLHAPNLWPSALPSMRQPLVEYFDAVADLAQRLTRIFAVALGVDEEFFVERCRHPTETLRLIRYERAPGSPDPLPEQMRMGAHTDYGIVTVLYGDRVPGLEVLGPDGEWHGVIPVEGAYLVNLGDLLAEWTNDRWRSTLHRVVPPPAGTDGSALRRSAAFFLDGDYDALVECLPTCCDDEHPAKYPPVLAGEHLMSKLLGPRTLEIPDVELDTVGDRSF
jgi:isopenicillin N synthase-like dioxygenase